MERSVSTTEIVQRALDGMFIAGLLMIFIVLYATPSPPRRHQ